MIIPTGDEILMEEKWVLIPHNIIPYAYDNRYYISTWGRIYNSETGNILPKNIYYDKDKYITIHLSSPIDDLFYVVQPHRIALMTFNYIEECENLDVNHKDGVKYHNWIWNLEWATRSENIQHALKNNLFNVGETRKNTKLTNSQVEYICSLIQEGKTPTEIENIINIPECNISTIVENIKSGYSWKHISKNYDFSNASRKELFTNDQIHSICKYFETNGRNKSYKEVLSYLHIDYSDFDDKKLNRYNVCISGIRSKSTFKNICSMYNY